MISLTAKWVEAVACKDADTRFYMQIYDGTNTWYCTSGSMDSGSNVYGYPVAIQNVTPLGLELDPVTREFSADLIDVVVDAQWIRPIWASNKIKGQRCRIYIGAASLDAFEFEDYARGQIEDAVYNAEDNTVTLKVLGQLAIVNRANIASTFFLNKHPLVILKEVLEYAGAHTLNANSFDPTQAEFDVIEHLIVSRATTNQHGAASQLTDWTRINQRKQQTGGTLAQELVQLMNGQLVENESGEIEFNLYNPSASTVADFTEDDLLEPIEIETTDSNVINRFVAHFGPSPNDTSKLLRNFTVNNTTSQSTYAFPGEADRIISEEFNMPWCGTPMWLKANIADSDVAFDLYGISCYALSGNQSGLTIDADHPVYLMLDSSFVSGENGIEIVKATSLTRNTSSDGLVDVWNRGVWETAGPFTSWISLASVSRAQFGTTAQAHVRGAQQGSTWIYDITPMVLLFRTMLRRFAYGCPIISIKVPTRWFGVQLGDTVSVTTARFLANNYDGLDSTDKFEVIGKAADFYAGEIVLRLAAVKDEVTAEIASGDIVTNPLDIQMSTATQSSFASQFYVESGLIPTQDTGSITSVLPLGGGIVVIATSAAHNLVVGDTVTQSGCADAAYNGTFTVLLVPTSQSYTITAVYTATDTGTWVADFVATVSDGVTASQGEFRPGMSKRLTFTASKDTYLYTTVAFAVSGSVRKIAVANGAADPGNAADEIYIATVVTDANGITSISTDETNREPLPGEKLVKESVGVFATSANNIGRNHNFDFNVWTDRRLRE